VTEPKPQESRPQESRPQESRPLAGLRVLELARILAGPWVGQLLADLGADVIKVESPSGDDTRQWGPPFVEGENGENLSAAYFHACNRGKRSIVADFGKADDLAMVKRLVAHADIVVENFKVGGLKKYGLDATTLRKAHPRLVYASITGFGQTGPYAERAGYDFMIQGMTGAMSITGEADGSPQKAGYATADIFTGMYTSVAILAALRQRDATGQGSTIDCALFEAQTAVLGNQAMNYLISGTVPARMGNSHPNIVPYSVYPAQDGHLILATGNDRQFRDAMLVLGAGHIADNPAYANNAGRIAHRAKITVEIEAVTTRLKRDDMLNRFEKAKVPAGPINTIADVFADPQAKSRGIKVDLVHPKARGGKIPTVRGPILLNGKPMVAKKPSPVLDGDRESILTDKNWGN
jgi:crotonobetainyl-CoA:carnitine CoA-transferase CaiB-like acyl-CoA transferase